MDAIQQRGINLLLSGIIAFAIITYPIVIYQNIQNVNPDFFAGIVLLAFSLRFILDKKSRQYPYNLLFVIVAIFCICIIILNSEPLLKFYPVLMNIGMGLLFLFSLKQEKSLIEQFVHASGTTPPEGAIIYLKNLTLAWAILLLTNGTASAFTACCTSLNTWALYNGLIAYIIIGSFVICELLYRAYYKRKHNLVNE